MPGPPQVSLRREPRAVVVAGMAVVSAAGVDARRTRFLALLVALVLSRVVLALRFAVTSCTRRAAARVAMVGLAAAPA